MDINNYIRKLKNSVLLHDILNNYLSVRDIFDISHITSDSNNYFYNHKAYDVIKITKYSIYGSFMNYSYITKEYLQNDLKILKLLLFLNKVLKIK